MSRHDHTVYLRHMLDHARDASMMIQSKKREDLETDRTLRYALLHVACITGEAAVRVSPDQRRNYPNIPWAPLIGMRNRLIHGYDTVDFSVLWSTISDDFPLLISALEAALQNLPGTET